MSPNPSRRRFLTAATSGVAATVAGCSSLPFTGGSSTDPARDWLYDPETYVDNDAFSVTVEFRSPSRLDEVIDELNDDLRSPEQPLYTDGLDADRVDSSVRVSEALLNGPYVVAQHGDFDADDAADAAAETYQVTDRDPDDVASIGGLDVVEYESGVFSAYDDGEAVAIQAPTELDVEAFVAAGTDGDAEVVAARDGYEPLVDAVGFDHTAQLWFVRTEEGLYGGGYGYTVDGETTTVRWASVDGFTEEEMESSGDDIDGLDDVTVETDGDLVVLSATADTDRLALNGSVIQLQQTPFE